jgi:hypothetical protein
MVGYILQKGVWKNRKRLKYVWEGDMLKEIKKVPLGIK